MQFQPMYVDRELFLPEIDLHMTSDQTLGIITDLKRKQLLMSQLADHSQYYLFQAGAQRVYAFNGGRAYHLSNQSHGEK
jgi:ABC-2 type transport system ATP-binding protein